MIYTVTFNPALDVSGTVDELIPDEKCYIHGELRTAGGNGINAGIIASRLGMPVTLTGFIGGANGSELKSLLSKQLLKTAFIPINGNTRMNITISHNLTHRQTRLSFAGPIVRLTEWDKLTKFLKRLKAGKDLAILGGSLPPGIAPKNIADLVRSLRKKGIFCMVDMPAQTLVKVVQSHPDFIKPNLEEFQQLTGSKVITIKGVLQSMQKLQLSVPLICVSSVQGGAILANKQESWFGATPKLKIHSTVGAGDSMVGAMASRLAQDANAPLDELLKIGLAASCATLSESGLTLGSKKAIQSFIPRIKVKKIT